MKQLKFNSGNTTGRSTKKKNTTVNAVQNNRQSAVEVQIQTCYCMNDPSTVFQFVDRKNCMFSAITVEPCGDWMQEI